MTFDFLRYQDESTQATFFTLAANNWMALRIDMVSALMVILVAVAAALSSEDPGKYRNGRNAILVTGLVSLGGKMGEASGMNSLVKKSNHQVVTRSKLIGA